MKTLFDDSIGVVPPSPVDVDALMARERRRARLHRLGLVGGSGLVAATVAVVLVAAQPWAGPSPRTAPGESAPAPREEPAAAAERLTAALRAAVATHAATVTVRGDRDSPEPLKFQYVLRAGGTKPDGTQTVPAKYFSTSATATDTAGSGSITVTVTRTEDIDYPAGFAGPENAHQRCPDPNTIAGQVSCRVLDGPHGTRVVEQVLGGEQSRLVHKVRVLTPNGTLLNLDASNDGGQADDGPASRPAPVLSLDQLTAIGSDPGLTLPA